MLDIVAWGIWSHMLKIHVMMAQFSRSCLGPYRGIGIATVAMLVQILQIHMLLLHMCTACGPQPQVRVHIGVLQEGRCQLGTYSPPTRPPLSAIIMPKERRIARSQLSLGTAANLKTGYNCTESAHNC